MCLLTVKDANNKVVIVAFAVAAVENADVYKYMFSNVKKNEEMEAWINKETTTYFVDGHKGSAAGIPTEVPGAEGRRCLRHLISHVTPNVGEVSTRRTPSSTLDLTISQILIRITSTD